MLLTACRAIHTVASSLRDGCPQVCLRPPLGGQGFCFQFGATTNKAARTTRVHILAGMKALVSLGVEWLGRMGDRMFNF